LKLDVFIYQIKDISRWKHLNCSHCYKHNCVAKYS